VLPGSLRSVLSDKLPAWRTNNRVLSRSSTTRCNGLAATGVTVISGSCRSLRNCQNRHNQNKDRKSESAHNERIGISVDQILHFIVVREFSCNGWWLVEMKYQSTTSGRSGQPIFQIGFSPCPITSTGERSDNRFRRGRHWEPEMMNSKCKIVWLLRENSSKCPNLGLWGGAHHR